MVCCPFAQALLCVFLGEYERNDQIGRKPKLLCIVTDKSAAAEIAIAERFSLQKNYFCAAARAGSYLRLYRLSTQILLVQFVQPDRFLPYLPDPRRFPAHRTAVCLKFNIKGHGVTAISTYNTQRRFDFTH